jgi:hypothetical protein
MKKLLSISLVFLLSGWMFGQSQMINNFDAASPDTNYWSFFPEHGGQHYQTNTGASDEHGFIHITHVGAPVAEGAGAMQLEYSAHNTESWGGYTKLEHWNPDSNAVYDFSKYDTLSLWYYNSVPQSQTGRVHLRVNLHDVSDSPNGYKTYDVGETEYYYSFHYVLDDSTAGWHQIKIPMISNGSWDGNGFNLTGWSGIAGNSTLDLDKIKGFSFEFSINGGGEGDFVTGTVILDKMELRGIAADPFVIFNGKIVDNAMSQFAWGQSNLELVTGAAENPKLDALLWTQGDEWGNGWSGAGWNVNPTRDIQYRWALDSLNLKMKVDEGTNNPIHLQFESGADGKVFYLLDVIADNQWHEYKVPLSSFENGDGTTNFNPAAISVFQFMGHANAIAGKKIYFEHIWTGTPVFDVINPEKPALVSAVPGQYSNLITWVDVPGENKETYDVYYSFNPITDVTAPGVEIVQANVAEGSQVAEHVLMAPQTDQSLTYYYAVVCKDAAGNLSEVSPADAPVTNTAKGVTTINPTAPSNFAADGDLSEWNGIAPFRMFPSDNSGSVVTNTKIDGDADLSVNAYLAMDSENLYVAFDVEDDIISSDTTIASYLRDAPDLFIGLYDWHGPSHISPKRGAEPDYQIRFNQTTAIVGNVGDTKLATNGDVNYIWKEKFPTGYTVEAKFPFAQIAGVATPDDEVFVPAVGKRIKIDFSINDADATGSREGIMTYSPINEDRSWADVWRWTYTWIGDKMTGVEGTENLPTTFELSQNYPNPFNPTTQIRYSVKDRANVSIKVFNTLGQQVAELVNETKNAGVYTVNFDASKLASGVYIYQMNAGSFSAAKKLMLLK